MHPFIQAAIPHLQKDETLQIALEDTVFPELNFSNDVFFALLRSICSQQLSVKAAATIFGRFKKLFPKEEPTPEAVLAYPHEELRAVGLSNRKASYIQNVATFALENKFDSIDWATKSDAELITFLSQIKGVGVWTVQMLLMFTLARPDVLPVLDLGIQQGIAKLYGLDSKGKVLQAEMTEIAEAWRPHRTVACLTIWGWKDNN